MVVNFKNDMVGDNVVRASLEGTLVSQQGVKKKNGVCRTVCYYESSYSYFIYLRILNVL